MEMPQIIPAVLPRGTPISIKLKIQIIHPPKHLKDARNLVKNVDLHTVNLEKLLFRDFTNLSKKINIQNEPQKKAWRKNWDSLFNRLTNGLAILVGGSDIHHVRRPVQVVMLHSRPMTVELKIKEIMLRSRPVKAELKIKEIGVMLRSKPLTAEVKTKERRSIN